MTFTTESAVQQATNLLHLYNGLKVFSIDEVQITLRAYPQIASDGQEGSFSKQ